MNRVYELSLPVGLHMRVMRRTFMSFLALYPYRALQTFLFFENTHRYIPDRSSFAGAFRLHTAAIAKRYAHASYFINLCDFDPRHVWTAAREMELACNLGFTGIVFHPALNQSFRRRVPYFQE